MTPLYTAGKQQGMLFSVMRPLDVQFEAWYGVRGTSCWCLSCWCTCAAREGKKGVCHLRCLVTGAAKDR